MPLFKFSEITGPTVFRVSAKFPFVEVVVDSITSHREVDTVAELPYLECLVFSSYIVEASLPYIQCIVEQQTACYVESQLPTIECIVDSKTSVLCDIVSDLPWLVGNISESNYVSAEIPFILASIKSTAYVTSGVVGYVPFIIAVAVASCTEQINIAADLPFITAELLSSITGLESVVEAELPDILCAINSIVLVSKSYYDSSDVILRYNQSRRKI